MCSIAIIVLLFHPFPKRSVTCTLPMHTGAYPTVPCLLVENKEAYEINLILIQGLLEYAFKILTVRSVQYFLPETFTVFF